MNQAIRWRAAGLYPLLPYLVLSTVAIQVLMVLPLFVGAVAEGVGLNDVQVGYLASADLAGFSLACLSAPLWSHRLAWRPVISVALAIAVAANLFCLWAEAFAVLWGWRGLAGVAAGVVYALSVTAIGRSPNPDRAFGIAFAAQTLGGAVALVAVPSLISVLGHSSLYAGMALLFVCGFLVFPWARGVPPAGDRPADGGAGRWWWPGMGLAGTFALYLGEGAVWAYVERIADGAGLAGAFIGETLAVGTFVGFLGGLAAAATADRYGRRLPLLAVFVGQGVALLLLVGDLDGTRFFLSMCLYNFFWVYAVSYHLAIIASADASGRLVALAPALQGMGLAAGPSLAAVSLAGEGYGAVIWIGFGGGAVSLLLMSVVTGRITSVRSGYVGAMEEPA